MKKPYRKAFYFREGQDQLTIEFARKLCFGFEVHIGGENVIWLIFGFVFFNLHIVFESWKIHKALKLPDDARQTGIWLTKPKGKDAILYLNLWQNANEWRNEDWRKIVNLSELLWGKRVFSREVLEERGMLIQMSEGLYSADVVFHRDTWTQSRKFWDKSKTVMRASVDIPAGIPFPGKGDNSYDLDDDALYSVTIEAKTVEEVEQKIIDLITKYRQR